jgi:uncharacterized iron-regulated membrane protein
MSWRRRVSSVVKQSLASHAWLGLLCGGLMYLICLSGTLVVFYQELERWEQPEIAESLRYDPAAVQRAVSEALDRLPSMPPHLYIGLPTPASPRISVSTDAEGEAWFAQADGALGDPIAHDWTHLVQNLHIYLHLPSTVGLLVVGALGALLSSLVVSGFLAHPRIFKDAFHLRLNGSLHQEQADLHNRLSVWGAPFHIVIALTGAYFGLAGVFFLLLGAAFHNSDTDAATAAIYATEPQVQNAPGVPDIARALLRMDEVIPAATSPSFITVHDAGSGRQFVEFEVVHPRRLIWAEYYRFDGDGDYLGRSDYSDGPIGRQIIYSSYRIHFGNFAGWPGKVLYALLGLSLTIISATGVNIWLAKRRTRDYLNDLWMGTIWGAPTALALTAVISVLFGIPSTAVFWSALAAALSWALYVGHPARAKRDLCALTALLITMLLAGYVVHFDTSRVTPIAWWVNGGLLAIAVVMMTIALRTREARGRVERSAMLTETGEQIVG